MIDKTLRCYELPELFRAALDRAVDPDTGELTEAGIAEIRALTAAAQHSSADLACYIRELELEADAVKATAGKLYGWYMFNAASSTRYVKFYNDTVANVIVGTTVPTLTIPLPAGAAANVEFSMGIPFSSAITIAATTGVGTADTGAPGANEVIVNIFYK